MIVMRWPPADVLHPIACLELQPFRDAGYARADYHLSVQSVIYGIHRAINSHLLDLATFDLAAYETYEKVENGDWNWITPGFLAFASPVEQGYPKSVATGTGGAPRSLSRSFRNVLEEFEKANVKVVIRLNKKLYDPAHFKERGIEHVESAFAARSCPWMPFAYNTERKQCISMMGQIRRRTWSASSSICPTRSFRTAASLLYTAKQASDGQGRSSARI